MHFLLTHVKKCIRSAHRICQPVHRPWLTRLTSGPEVHSHTLWKEKMGKVYTERATLLAPLKLSVSDSPRATLTIRVWGRIVFLAPARWCSFSKCSFQMFPSCPVQPQVYRLGLGPAGSFKRRTSVTWKAKLTSYLTPLKLGVFFCKDGICLVGHSHVAQLEALRAQQTEEK